MMAYGNFERCLKLVLVHEGGFANHPKDPGGATMKGVTQRVYDGFRLRSGKAKRSVKEISESELTEIYRDQYWNPINGDGLPLGVDYVVFDGAVNSGVGQSVKWLQRSLPGYTGAIDGDMGSGTMGAVIADHDNDALVDRILDRRMAFLKALKTWPTFGKGWTARVDGVRKVAKSLASARGAPSVPFVDGAQTKAIVEDAKKSPGKGIADGAAGGGVASGALAGTLSKLQEQLTPFSAAGGWIQTTVVVLIITSAVLTIGGLAYRWYANRRKNELADTLDLQPVSK